MKNIGLILDIGSSKITCMAATKISSVEFAIKAVGQSAYSGFDENGFFEPQKLSQAIQSAISQVESKIQMKAKEIIVGVPANFCTIFSNESRVVFNSRKKVDAYDINELFKKANIYGTFPDKKLISRHALCYYLDDLSLEYNPIGLVADRISAVISFSYMSKYFEGVLNSIFSTMSAKPRYVNASELQAGYINSIYSVASYSIVVDVGHLTTSFMLARGRGLAFCRNFSLGSAYFAADLSQVFDIKYDVAEQLVSKLNLRLEYGEEATYTIGDISVEAAKANEVVKARIEQISEYIRKSYNDYNHSISEKTPIILTGGGLTYLKGAAECLTYFLGREVIVYSNVDTRVNKNELTSCYGLLQFAMSFQKEKTSFFSNIKKIFGGKNKHG